MTNIERAEWCGTQVGPTGPFGHPPVPLFRTRQDEIPTVPGGHGGQPDPGGGETRTVGPGRWRPNRPQRRPEYSPLCCRKCYRQFLRSPPRTTVARDSAHAGFTAQMSLPNENFPATFLIDQHRRNDGEFLPAGYAFKSLLGHFVSPTAHQYKDFALLVLFPDSFVDVGKLPLTLDS